MKLATWDVVLSAHTDKKDFSTCLGSQQQQYQAGTNFEPDRLQENRNGMNTKSAC